MSWTKARLIQNAYGAFGLQALAFSLTPEMQGAACDILDAMMAAWGTEYGIRIGYNNGGGNTPDPAQQSGIPDHCNEAVYMGLADRLADTIGKTLSLRMMIRRQETFDQLVSWCQSANIPEMQYRRDTPAGAGTKPYETATGGIFIQPVEQLDTGSGDGFIDGEGGTPILP